MNPNYSGGSYPGLTPTLTDALAVKTYIEQIVAGLIPRLYVGRGSVMGDGTDGITRAVSHGLGETPLSVVANVETDGLYALTYGYSPTQFSLRVEHINGTGWTGPYPFSFVAFGSGSV